MHRERDRKKETYMWDSPDTNPSYYAYKMTSYILEKGGDVNFRFNWDDKFRPGQGNYAGTALDFVRHYSREYECQANAKMIELLTKYVSIFIYILILKNIKLKLTLSSDPIVFGWELKN